MQPTIIGINMLMPFQSQSILTPPTDKFPVLLGSLWLKTLSARFVNTGCIVAITLWKLILHYLPVELCLYFCLGKLLSLCQSAAYSLINVYPKLIRIAIGRV